VPGLGAIPILGNLFKSRSGSRQKKNLLVFIRPSILRDSEATEAKSESKYNEVREDEKTLNHGHITLLPGEKQPVISPIPPKSALPPAPPPAITNPAGATPNPPSQPAPVVPAPQTTAPPQPAAPAPQSGSRPPSGAP
jgi:general secretion pathway protein D